MTVERPRQRFRIFYSWQSDRDRACCKDFVRIAADAAATKVSELRHIDLSVRPGTNRVL